jgi:DNA-binding CsgD family transcriptional regulator
LGLLSQSLSMASIAENMAGECASARRLLDEAQVITAGLDDLDATLALLQARALNGMFEGDLEAVRSTSLEGIHLSREAGDLYRLEMMLINLGLAALSTGDLRESEPLFAEGLRIANKIDDRVAQYFLLDAFGCHAAASGQARRAAQLLGAAEAVRTGARASEIATLTQLVARAEELAVVALGTLKFEAEFKTGKRLSRQAASALALGESGHVAAAVSERTATGLLGKRQAEVAELVAEGLSNKQIGARLFISEHTVDSHVRSILNKLGVNSRAQIAGWVAAANQ